MPNGEPTLVLIHGAGGTHRVWDGVRDLWSGRSVALDLAGHGAAIRYPSYGYDVYATAVLDRLRDRDLIEQPLLLVGHSLGGATALTLAASHPDLDVRAVVAIGTKTTWTSDDLEGMRSIADKGVRWFEEEGAAREWFLRVNGLVGLIAADSDVVGSGIAEDADRGWRLVADPEVYRVEPFDLAAVLHDGVPAVLARGADDAMVPRSDLEGFGREPLEIPGAGHNGHVSHPSWVVALLSAV